MYPMDEVYKDVSEKFLNVLRLYMMGEVGYEEVKRCSEHEGLAFEDMEMEKKIVEKEMLLLKRYRGLYDKILTVEKLVREAGFYSEGKNVDVSLEMLLNHAKLLGGCRPIPAGHEGHLGYVGVYPGIGVVDALNRGLREEEELIAEKSDVNEGGGELCDESEQKHASTFCANEARV